MDRPKIESIICENGYNDFNWISGKDVVVMNRYSFMMIE